MTILRSATLVAAVLWASAAAAQDSPWEVRIQTVNGDFYTAAMQPDSTLYFRIGLFCDQETFERKLIVESSEDWEDDASYAPDVPTRIVIDGVDRGEVTFRFAKHEGRESIVGTVADIPDFEDLVRAIAAANGRIDVSYFNKSASFAALGAAAAIGQVDAICPQNVAALVPDTGPPWQTLDAAEGDMQLRYAFQTDNTGQYRFAVSCVIGKPGYNMFVMTPDAWDDATTYDTEVPLTLSFDGEPRTNLRFYFANGGGFLMVAYRQENFRGELMQLIGALKATTRFDVSYFDTALSFSGKGSTAAIESIETACFG
jgi:hypothetical protein